MPFKTDKQRKAFYAKQGYIHTPHLHKPRQYLPHGLTNREKHDPELKHKLSRCIRAVEKKEGITSGKNYKRAKYNPVAVCRASIEK